VNIISDGIIGVVLGFAAHQLKRPTEDLFMSESTCFLVKCVEGGVMVILYDAFLQRKITDKSGWATIRLILAFFFTGGGTVLGHMLDNWRARDK
jgi:hypothetical protein